MAQWIDGTAEFGVLNDPTIFFFSRSQTADRITVFAAMSSTHLFGPYFFPETVSGTFYRDILSEFFWPDMVEQLGNRRARFAWFMQDGAPAHTAKESRQLVQTMFSNRCVGRYFNIEWPPRSPDLSPLDFFLWGFVKNRVYRQDIGPVRNVSDLMERISAAFDWVRTTSMDNVRHAVDSFYSRLNHCVAINGAQLGLHHR